MGGRFQVRPGDAGGFGVWDSAVSGWRSAQTLTRQAVADLAADLDVQYGPHGVRLPADVRRCDPPTAVDGRTWQAVGLLEVWVKERGRWWGRIRDVDGQPRWLAADDLRPQLPPR